MSTIPQVSQAMQQLLTTVAQDANAKLHYTKLEPNALITDERQRCALLLAFVRGTAQPNAANIARLRNH